MGGRGGDNKISAQAAVALAATLKGIGRLIGATHGVIDEHANNCINASASTSTNTIKNASTSSAVLASTAPV